MPRRKPDDAEMEDRDPTIEEISAIAGMDDIPPMPTLGTAPSGIDEDDVLTDEQIADRDQARVVGPDLMMPRIMAALESLKAREQEAGTGNTAMAAAMTMLAEALVGLRTGQMEAAKLQADMQRRVTRPENAFSPQISAYNPRGDKDFPRPPLKCPMFIPWPVEAESHTREEVELLNLLEPGEFLITRADRTKVKLTVQISRKLDSNEPSQLSINHETAFNNDYHRQMPYDWIRQLASANPKTRAAAAAVVTMEEEAALILARKFNDGRLAAEGERVLSIAD